MRPLQGLLQGFEQGVLRLHRHALGIFQQHHALSALAGMERQGMDNLAQMIDLDGALLFRAGGGQKIGMAHVKRAAAAPALHAGLFAFARA